MVLGCVTSSSAVPCITRSVVMFKRKPARSSFASISFHWLWSMMTYPPFNFPMRMFSRSFVAVSVCSRCGVFFAIPLGIKMFSFRIMLTRTGRGLLVGGSFRRRTFQLIAQFLDGFLNCEIGVPARMFLVIAQPGFHEFPLGGGRKLFQFRVDEVK